MWFLGSAGQLPGWMWLCCSPWAAWLWSGFLARSWSWMLNPLSPECICWDCWYWAWGVPAGSMASRVSSLHTGLLWVATGSADIYLQELLWNYDTTADWKCCVGFCLLFLFCDDKHLGQQVNVHTDGTCLAQKLNLKCCPVCSTKNSKTHWSWEGGGQELSCSKQGD